MFVILIIIVLHVVLPFNAAECSSAGQSVYAYSPEVKDNISLTMRIAGLGALGVTHERTWSKKGRSSKFKVTGCASGEHTLNYRGILAKNAKMQAMALSPDEDLFALVLTNEEVNEERTWIKILIWDIAEKTLYKRLDASVNTVEGPFKLAINRDCTAIALSTENPLFVWALKKQMSKAKHRRFPTIIEDAPHELIRPPVFYENDAIFCADQTTIRRLDLSSAGSRTEYTYGRGLNDMDRHGDRLIATGQQGAKIWDIPSGELLHTYPGYMIGTNIRFSIDGEHVVVGTGSDTKNYQVWRKVHEHEPRYKTIRHAFSCIDTPEAFREIKAELLSYASGAEASETDRRDAHVALAIRCRAIANAIPDELQKKFYAALSEKYMKLAQQ